MYKLHFIKKKECIDILLLRILSHSSLFVNIIELQCLHCLIFQTKRDTVMSESISPESSHITYEMMNSKLSENL